MEDLKPFYAYPRYPVAYSKHSGSELLEQLARLTVIRGGVKVVVYKDRSSIVGSFRCQRMTQAVLKKNTNLILDGQSRIQT